MRIEHFRYLITVVESGYNISVAAKKLYTSQSAISQMILKFEEENNVVLFHREKGRLKELTPLGMELYREMVEIVRLSDKMMESLAENSKAQAATLKIGIPELITTVFFQDFFQSFIKDNPSIKLEIYEEGSKQLAEMLESQELDFAILVNPSHLNPKNFNETILINDELVAYMSEDNILANKEVLSWKDMAYCDIALFNRSFITYELVNSKLSEEKINNPISLTSTSWNFILDVCKSNNMLTFFASEVSKQGLNDGIVARRFKDPIPFVISLWSQKLERTSMSHEVSRGEILKYAINNYG